MVKVIMHGCNGHMGQVITQLVEKDPEIEIVAGIDLNDCRDNGYPVFTDIWTCDVQADAVIDFCTAKATDTLLEYCEKRQIPVVLCTTGLTDEQIKKVEETSKHVAVLKSENMSLGINLLMKLVIAFYEQSKEALDKGANIQGLIKMDVREKIGRFKYVTEDKLDKEYKATMDELAADIANVFGKEDF